MAGVPEVVYIAPHLWRVDSADETGSLLRDEGARGDTRGDYLLIRVDPNRPASAVAETVLHELLHALLESTPIKGEDLEEPTVTALAPKLLAMLRDNPALVVYLVGVDESE